MFVLMMNQQKKASHSVSQKWRNYDKEIFKSLAINLVSIQCMLMDDQEHDVKIAAIKSLPMFIRKFNCVDL